ncbi:hypothetical protein GIB67_020057 [Kingdonia uniflora]|uniref:Uncharacterized protein n=1 Tax=Kingdonia uniflora TaxID=39325 RepID=A0A7J7L294_9MAGN|nr:hypothetical protein GIB67_020057 [Kingdonia uniflora]
MAKTADQGLLVDFLSKLKKSKWLNTYLGYRIPDECLLFDPAWKDVLNPDDASFLDVEFYGHLHSYKDQLKVVGVKVDARDVCSEISENFASHLSTFPIKRIYNFLMKFNWRPESPSDSNSKLINIKLHKLSAALSGGIDFVAKDEVFIPDDLQLKKIFTEASRRPLFVWQPNCSSVGTVKLYDVYSSLRVRRVSEAVHFDSTCFSSIDYKLYKVDSNNEFIVAYSLPLLFAKSMEVKTRRLVIWEKKSLMLFVRNLSFEDRKRNIEFVTCFAHAVSEGLLVKEKGDLIDMLSKIIQMGFMFDFKDEAVEFLLTRENLELYEEDNEFLTSAFPSEVLIHNRIESEASIVGVWFISCQNKNYKK